MNGQETKLSPQERKEEFISELQKKIEDRFEDGETLSTGFETCSRAPVYGWSREEYLYMPKVAMRLREKGYTVSSKVNFEVTDWSIAL
jgi:hypothetical protein